MQSPEKYYTKAKSSPGAYGIKERRAAVLKRICAGGLSEDDKCGEV